MMTASIYGRLGRDVKEIQTKSGKAMAVVGVAVDVGKPSEQETLWLDLIAFGAMADRLLRHQKSDMVAASGRITLNRWTDNQGEDRETWQLIVDTLVSARTVRSGMHRQSPVSRDVPGAPLPFDQPPPVNEQLPPQG